MVLMERGVTTPLLRVWCGCAERLGCTYLAKGLHEHLSQIGTAGLAGTIPVLLKLSISPLTLELSGQRELFDVHVALASLRMDSKCKSHWSSQQQRRPQNTSRYLLHRLVHPSECELVEETGCLVSPHLGTIQ